MLQQTRSNNDDDDDDGFVENYDKVIGMNVSSIAMKLKIEIPVRRKMTSWFLYIWTQMLWLQLIMEMMIVVTY